MKGPGSRVPLAIALSILVAAYSGLCAWVYFNQRSLIYFPQFTRVDPADTEIVIHRENVTLRGWLVNPGRRSAILYFGGNAERIEQSRTAFAAWFPDSSVYLIAYRGYGASDGSPRERDLFADALAIYDHAEARHGGGIAVVGRSLGSGVASYVASQRPVSRLVLITPFDSMARLAAVHYPWLPVRWLITERYESTRHLADYRGPILLIRAGRDTVVPAASTARLAEAMSRAPATAVLPTAGHNSLDDNPGYREALRGFLQVDPATAALPSERPTQGD